MGLVMFHQGTRLVAPGLGADSDVSAGAEKARKAADTFAALAKDAYRTGDAPRNSDASIAALLDDVFNVDAVKAKPALRGVDRRSLDEWSLAATRVGVIYLLAGTGVSEDTGTIAGLHRAFERAQGDLAVARRSDRNVVAFAPEVGRWVDATVTLAGATPHGVAEASDDATTKLGWDKARAGITTMLMSDIRMLQLDGLSDAWRLDRLRTLNATAPRLVELLLPAQCSTLRDAARSAIEALRDPAVKSGLEAFSGALKC